jgi:hypothetical protein
MAFKRQKTSPATRLGSIIMAAAMITFLLLDDISDFSN